MIERTKGKNAADQKWMGTLKPYKLLEVQSSLYHDFKLSPNYDEYSVHSIAIAYEQIAGVWQKVIYDSARPKRVVVTSVEAFARSLVHVWDTYYFRIGLPGEEDVRHLFQDPVDSQDARDRAAQQLLLTDGETVTTKAMREESAKVVQESKWAAKRKEGAERTENEAKRLKTEKDQSAANVELLKAEGLRTPLQEAHARRQAARRRRQRAEKAECKRKLAARVLAKSKSKELAKQERLAKPVLSRAMSSLSNSLKW